MDAGVAGFADHEGLASPPRHDLHPFGLDRLSRLVEIRELADLVHAHLVRLPAELAPSRQEPVDQLLAAGVAGTGSRSRRIAFFCRRSGIPPKVATSGFLPSPRSTLTCRHLRGPCGVSIVAPYLRAIFDTDESYLPASVFSSEVTMTQCSRSSR